MLVGLSVLINIKIWQGHSWARIVALILTLLAATGYAMQIRAFATVLAVTGMLLDIVGLYLVFVPGRAWFARR